MNATHPNHKTGLSQESAILDRLKKARGAWVPMPVLGKASGSAVVHSRIASLRRRFKDLTIENRCIRKKDGVHSSYRLITGR
jgi:hypothetical protein